ncbi:hypothetical protein N7475_004997 [Penicillium sp. IBT 31633x]|nr:hypothetical protein N7475_004997 [Penicillium sp. IBT 31633x]
MQLERTSTISPFTLQVQKSNTQHDGHYKQHLSRLESAQVVYPHQPEHSLDHTIPPRAAAQRSQYNEVATPITQPYPSVSADTAPSHPLPTYTPAPPDEAPSTHP